MLRAVILVVTLLAALPCAAADLAGQATVIDGDTLEIHGQRIRLYGIDAPERDQLCGFHTSREKYPCGEYAYMLLDGSISKDEIRREQRDVDRYRRIVAVCYLGDMDLGAMLVKGGWALAYRKYSLDYVDEEDEAKAAKRGMWRGTFMPPWKWREIIERQDQQSG